MGEDGDISVAGQRNLFKCFSGPGDDKLIWRDREPLGIGKGASRVYDDRLKSDFLRELHKRDRNVDAPNNDQAFSGGDDIEEVSLAIHYYL